MKVREALNDLKAGIVQPVYLLKGGDPFLQSFFIEHVAKTFFGTQPVDKTLMLPDDMKGKEIISQLTISDLFAGKKLWVGLFPVCKEGSSKVGTCFATLSTLTMRL